LERYPDAAALDAAALDAAALDAAALDAAALDAAALDAAALDAAALDAAALDSGGEADPGAPPPGLVVAFGGSSSWGHPPTQGGVALIGGGAEPDEAVEWLLDRAGHGDVVVLRMGDAGGNYVPYFLGLGASSVRELSFDPVDGEDEVHGAALDLIRARANAPYMTQLLQNAELVFLAGGNQTKYYDAWHDTAVSLGISSRGSAPLGGTSAGMQALTRILHTPRGPGDSVLSSDALRDPYISVAEISGSRSLELTAGPFDVPLLRSYVADAHFSERDRLGRVFVFVARAIQDGLVPAADARAIAVDEGAAVCIDERGLARVFGSTGERSPRTGRAYQDDAFFFRPRGAPQVCADDTPLDWPLGVDVMRVPGYRDGRGSVDLGSWSVAQGTPFFLTVDQGVLSADIQTPD